MIKLILKMKDRPKMQTQAMKAEWEKYAKGALRLVVYFECYTCSLMNNLIMVV